MIDCFFDPQHVWSFFEGQKVEWKKLIWHIFAVIRLHLKSYVYYILAKALINKKKCIHLNWASNSSIGKKWFLGSIANVQKLCLSSDSKDRDRKEKDRVKDAGRGER